MSTHFFTAIILLFATPLYTSEPSLADAKLCRSARDGNITEVDNALRCGARVNCKVGGLTPLGWAASRGYNTAIVHLLDAGAAINPRGSSPLIAAAENGQIGSIPLLLLHGAHINDAHAGKTALSHAIQHGKTSAVEKLLAAGADMNASRIYPLNYAAYLGYPDIVAVVLKATLDVSSIEEMGVTALLAAAYGRHRDLLKMHPPASHHQEEVIRFLFSRGVLPPTETQMNEAPCMNRQGLPDEAKSLIRSNEHIFYTYCAHVIQELKGICSNLDDDCAFAILATACGLRIETESTKNKIKEVVQQTHTQDQPEPNPHNAPASWRTLLGSCLMPCLKNTAE